MGMRAAISLESRRKAAHDLAYRLYAICEREATTYNVLVASWPERLLDSPNSHGTGRLGRGRGI